MKYFQYISLKKMDLITQAAELIKSSNKTIAFTGAGISVESGIDPFRGKGGIWSKFDPIILDLNYYKNHPQKSWSQIFDLFYKDIPATKPNLAHRTLAQWESNGQLFAIITQNIDNLHQNAGSKTVFEFHGTTNSFLCTSCHSLYNRNEIMISKDIPVCLNKSCQSLLKPNFIFFGEDIPREAYNNSIQTTVDTDIYIIIGTSGEVSPANQIPIMAKQNGSTIIEINISPSLYTEKVTDIYLQGKASVILNELQNKLNPS